MPRYFFHLRDGQSYPDEDGVELPDDAEACQQAVVAAGEALRDNRGKFWNSGDWFMEVVDETGAPICALRFSGVRASS
jgi:hypothetical protein